MSITVLLMVAAISTFGVLWLINYLPLVKKVPLVGYRSPRLWFCKVLVPFDISVTLWLIVGSVLGLGTTMLGISTLIYNSFVAVGISLGVYIVDKWLVPRWKLQYESKVKALIEEEAKKG